MRLNRKTVVVAVVAAVVLSPCLYVGVSFVNGRRSRQATADTAKAAGLQFAKNVAESNSVGVGAEWPSWSVRTELLNETDQYRAFVVTGSLIVPDAAGVKRYHRWESVVYAEPTAGEWLPARVSIGGKTLYGFDLMVDVLRSGERLD